MVTICRILSIGPLGILTVAHMGLPEHGRHRHNNRQHLRLRKWRILEAANFLAICQRTSEDVIGVVRIAQ